MTLAIVYYKFRHKTMKKKMEECTKPDIALQENKYYTTKLCFPRKIKFMSWDLVIVKINCIFI